MSCSLLPGLFGVAVQGMLFLMSLLVLVMKKKREEMTMGGEARDWSTFIFDSSKQLIGAGFVHGLNLVCANLLGGKFEGNGCDWYWLNIMIDTTIGVGIEYLILYALTQALESCGCRPQGFFRSGEYLTEGEFDWTRYASQVVMWLVCVTGMKFMVMGFMVVAHSQLQHIAEAFLDTVNKGGPQMELIIVMLITPCFMNAFQFWLTDNFIKKKSDASGKSYAEGEQGSPESSRLMEE